MKLALKAAATFLVLGTTSLVAKPVDLSEFAGTYRGTTSATLGPSTYPGTAVMAFKVRRGGRSGSLAVSANITNGVQTADASNNFTFAKSKALTIGAVLPPVAYDPIAGAYSVKRGRTINGSAVFVPAGTAYTAVLVVKIKKTSRRATLTATYSFPDVGIGAYQMVYTGTRRLKR
jgi:hypothetical protein